MNSNKIVFTILAVFTFLLVLTRMNVIRDQTRAYGPPQAEQSGQPAETSQKPENELTPAQKFAKQPYSGEKLLRHLMDYGARKMDAFKLNKELTQRQDEGREPHEFELFYTDVDAAMKQLSNCVTKKDSSCALLDYGITKFSPEHTERVAMLISLLDQTERKDASIFIITALSRIQDPRAVPVLVRQLTHAEGKAPYYAAQILMTTFKDQWDWRAAPIEEIINTLVQSKYYSTLKVLWDQTEHVLVKQLWSEDPDTRDQALKAFFAIGDDRIIPELTKFFHKYASWPLAQYYYNNGNDGLRLVVVRWAHARGEQLIVDNTPTYGSVSGWGNMD